MQPLRDRLNGEKEAVLAYTATYGRLLAMRKFGIKDYVCFQRWLKEVTGNENFGLNPTISSNGSQDLGDQLVAAFLRKVERLQAENARLRQELELLYPVYERRKERQDERALLVLQACQD